MLNLRSFFVMVLAGIAMQLNAQAPSTQIALNQVGFYGAAIKKAIIINAPAASKFYILSINKKDTFYRGDLDNSIKSRFSSALTKTADFTRLKKAGSYVLYVPAIGYSYPFNINKNIYYPVATAAVKAFYY
ncbi:MAG: cellulase, partial [Ferruginibacter sp.]|nr:cellulase [Ferruginibacter sp.]